jgi:ParB family chromosome partitioning protein
MTVPSNFSAIRGIPLKHLFLAPENVRKDDSEDGIPELADDIEAHGVLQNLAGYEAEAPRGKRHKPVGVVAGGRRYRACRLLLKQGRVDENYIVTCLVGPKEAAIAISLAENDNRKALHPADEFEAARALVDAGKSIEDVAALLRLQPLVVKRRLKLANVAPEFVQLYRGGKLSLEHMMAFAITDDHDRQQKAWKGLPAHSRQASAIRAALTENEINSRDPVARFVTLKAYEKAGGKTRRDLFSEDNDSFLLDVDLLKQLAKTKLDKYAAQLKADGLPWVDVSPRVDYSDRAGYGRVQMTYREPNKKERAKLDALEQELAEVRAQEESAEGDDDTLEALFERGEKIEEAQDTLREALAVPDPAQLPKAGALVCIDREGKLHVETGLLQPEDAKLFAQQAKKNGSSKAEKGKGAHSAALLLRFTALRTQALQAEFAQNPEVALAAVVHRFVVNTFSEFESDSPLKVITPEVHLQQFNKDLEGTHAHQWLAKQREHLRAMLPKDPEALFGWIMEQSHVEKLVLLAFCAARTLNAVQNTEASSKADPLAKALRMDLRKWWSPTATGYLGSIRREAVLHAVRESVSAEAAAKLEKLNKQPLALEAEKLLAGTGWLPEFAREAWAGDAAAANRAQPA